MSSHHKIPCWSDAAETEPALPLAPSDQAGARVFGGSMCPRFACPEGVLELRRVCANDWLAPSPVSPWTSAARNSRGRVRAMPGARTVPREPHRPRRLCGATRLIVVAPARRRSGQGAGSRTAAPCAPRRRTRSDAATAQCGRQRLAAGGGRQRAPGTPQKAQEGRSAASGAGSPPDGTRRRQDGSGRPGGQPSPERRRQPRRAAKRLWGQEGPGRRQGGAWTAQEARRPPFRPSAAVEPPWTRLEGAWGTPDAQEGAGRASRARRPRGPPSSGRGRVAA